jgi:hypothetical protein
LVSKCLQQLISGIDTKTISGVKILSSCEF